MQPDEFNPHRRFLGLFVPFVVSEHRDLTPGAKLCYGRLLTFAGANGYAWPSISTLAKAVGVSARHVQRYLKELREAEFIRIYDRSATHRSNVITFLRHPVLDDTAEPVWYRDSEERIRAPAPRVRTPIEELPSDPPDRSVTGYPHDVVVTHPHDVHVVPSLKNSERRDQRECREPAVASRPTAGAEPTAAPRPAAWKLGAARLDAISDPDPEPAAASRPSALREPGRAKARPSPPSHVAPTPKTFDPKSSGKSRREEPDEDPAEAIEEETPFDAVPEKPSSERLKNASEFAERLRQDLLVKRGASFQAAADKKARVGNFDGDGMSGASASLRARGQECRKVWFAELGIAFPDVTIAQFGAKENAQLKTLLEKYGGSIVADALRYVVREWASIRKRYMKGRLGPAPSIGWILACHEQLFSESQVWAKHAPVLQEWAEWWKRNPNNPYPPSDLKARYREAEKELGWMDRG